MKGWLIYTMQGLAGIKFSTATFIVSDTEVIERSGYTVILPDRTEQSGANEITWRRQGDGSWKLTRLRIT